MPPNQRANERRCEWKRQQAVMPASEFLSRHQPERARHTRGYCRPGIRAQKDCQTKRANAEQ